MDFVTGLPWHYYVLVPVALMLLWLGCGIVGLRLFQFARFMEIQLDYLDYGPVGKPPLSKKKTSMLLMLGPITLLFGVGLVIKYFIVFLFFIGMIFLVYVVWILELLGNFMTKIGKGAWNLMLKLGGLKESSC